MIPDSPHNIRIRLASLKFFLLYVHQKGDQTVGLLANTHLRDREETLFMDEPQTKRYQERSHSTHLE